MGDMRNVPLTLTGCDLAGGAEGALTDGGRTAGGLCGFFSLKSTPPAPPMLKAELADTDVAVVEKLISLPFLNLVKVLEADDEGAEPLYTEDAAEAVWLLRQDGTVVALVRLLYVLDAGDFSQRSFSPLRAGGELGSQPRCCERPRHDAPESDPDELGTCKLGGKGGGVKAMEAAGTFCGTDC